MRIRSLFVALALAAAAGLAVAQAQVDQVVYHVDDAAQQGLKALRNLRNHLDTAPTTQIAVVTHAAGVDLLMEGAKATDGTEFAPLVAALRNRGVVFEVCEITMKVRGLKKEQFIQEADFTPSGVVRLVTLQRQGYAYIKP